jgi:hypothetical protein
LSYVIKSVRRIALSIAAAGVGLAFLAAGSFGAPGQARYRAFGALDVDLAKNAAPLATYMTDNDRRYFSARVGGFFPHPVYGLDLAALSVR